MREKRWAPASIDRSVRIYAWLMAAYPAQFRAEYGHLMVQLFRDVCRRESSRRGWPGMAALWARTVLDLLRTSVEEHLDRGIDMNREKFVRWSGWALVAGAILFAAGLIIGSFDSSWEDPVGGVDAFYEISQIVGIVVGQAMLVIGLLGLRAGFASRSGGLGAALLMITVIGGVISLGGMLFMNSSEAGWAAWAFGLLCMTLGLSVYGVVTIRRKVFSRWNFAPLLAGVTIPVLFAIGLAVESSGGTLGEWAFVLGSSATSIGLVLLGYRMQAEAASISEALAG